METFIGIIVGILFGTTSVFFYVLGLGHGRKVKDGSHVRLEPLKAIIDIPNKIKEIKEDKIAIEKSKENAELLRKMLNYNGVGK